MKTILVIQLKRIGDLILTVPALAALRKAHPKAKISLIIDGDTAGMAPAMRDVDRVMVYKKNSLNIRTFRRLLLEKYDATLDFTGTDRSLLLTGLSKAEQRIAFRWAEKTQIRSYTYTHFVDSPVRDKHTIDHYLELLSGINVLSGDPVLHLELPKSAHKRVRDILQKRSVSSLYVVIHTGAARAEKYWSPQRWAEVIQYCQNKKKRPCLLIGGSSPMEKQAIEEIRPLCREKFIDLSGKLNLMASAALIAGADLFIGIDSGPSHLASAMQTPQITLFGPTNPFHWRARHDRSLVLQGGKQNPLAVFDSHATQGDLNALSTQEVIYAINQLLPTP